VFLRVARRILCIMGIHEIGIALWVLLVGHIGREVKGFSEEMSRSSGMNGRQVLQELRPTVLGGHWIVVKECTRGFKAEQYSKVVLRN